ncbi:hypothetical protein FRC04_003808 [Tulasnella sp. 424]|nr:hypothetical protein FRC04_003808 [Tulasnella sp. 424]KAG8973692.1 hypothetical protein FRC05_008279 [Tulasnella sp. 425]
MAVVSSFTALAFTGGMVLGVTSKKVKGEDQQYEDEAYFIGDLSASISSTIVWNIRPTVDVLDNGINAETDVEVDIDLDNIQHEN